MDQSFENFNDQDQEWLSDLEIRTLDLENELFDLREAHARELAETNYGREAASGRARDPRSMAGRAGDLRARARHAQPRQPQPAEAPDDVIDDEDPELDDDLTSVIRTGARPGWPGSPYRAPSAERR